jgi:hypothetical protein
LLSYHLHEVYADVRFFNEDGSLFWNGDFATDEESDDVSEDEDRARKKAVVKRDNAKPREIAHGGNRKAKRLRAGTYIPRGWKVKGRHTIKFVLGLEEIEKVFRGFYIPWIRRRVRWKSDYERDMEDLPYAWRESWPTPDPSSTRTSPPPRARTFREIAKEHTNSYALGGEAFRAHLSELIEQTKRWKNDPPACKVKLPSIEKENMIHRDVFWRRHRTSYQVSGLFEEEGGYYEGSDLSQTKFKRARLVED